MSEVASRGYQEIEKRSQDSHNREQALKYWRDSPSQILKALQCLVVNYCEQKLTAMERDIAQQITEGSSNFRLEIEGYLNSAELTFGK